MRVCLLSLLDARDLELEQLHAAVGTTLDAEWLASLDRLEVEDLGQRANDLVGLGCGEAALSEELAERVGLADLAFDRGGRADRRDGVGVARGEQRCGRDRHRRRPGPLLVRLLLDRGDAGLLVPHEHVEIHDDERAEDEQHPRTIFLGGGCTE
jgi:hypothetical protein